MTKPLILIFSLCFLLGSVSSITEAQVKAMNTPVSAAAAENDRVQDGLKGPVRRVRLEMAQLVIKDGKQVEGRRQLRGITTYDPKGHKLDSVAYPVEGDSLTGKEEYRYDEDGNIIEMIVRDDDGSILSKETYKYEFDALGNWNKMTTSVALYENGVVSSEPIEVSYRNIAYYYGAMAKLESGPKPSEKKTSARESAAPESSKSTNESRGSVSDNQARSSVVKESSPSVGNELERKPVLQPLTVSNVAENKPNLPVNSSANSETASAKPRNEESVAVNVSERSEKRAAATPLIVSSSDKAEIKSPQRDETSSAAAPYQTGLTYLASGAYDQALGFFNQLVRLNPNDPIANAKLGLAYSALHKYREAVASLNVAIRIKPAVINAEEYYQLGYSYSHLGMNTEAVGAFNKALYEKRQEAIDNDRPSGGTSASQIYYSLGLANYELKRYPEAIKALTEAVKLNPQLAEAYYSLGLAYIARGDLWSARKQQKPLLSLNPALARRLVDEISTSTLRENIPCASTGFCR